MMNRDQSISGSVKLPGNARRKAVQASPEHFVTCTQLYPGNSLPLLVQPAVDGVDLIHWAANSREFIETRLLQYGALLFRGFNIKTAEQFESCVTSMAGETLEYRERSSPRSQVSGNIYTSTDYPADQHIFLHNENSYQHTWPLRIFFFCKLPAQQGGETPIADVRKVYERIPPAIRERFQQRRVMYVRNFGDGLGLSWQTVFQTTEKSAVEEYCRKTALQYEWKDGNRLRTRRVGQAIARHPLTAEMLWFNHAAFFHVTTLPPQIRALLLAQFDLENLPNNSYYGNGSPIEPDVLDELRKAYEQETVTFPWQQGDVLMLDNMLVAHGRNPFVGERQILTAMALPFHASE